MLKDKLDLLNQKALAKIKAIEAGTESPESLINFLQSASAALIRLYPQDWASLLKEYKIEDHWHQIKSVNSLLNEYLKHFEVKADEGILELTLDDGTVIGEKLKDLNLILQIEWNIPKDHPLYFLLLGFLSQHDNYLLAQLYLSGKNLI